MTAQKCTKCGRRSVPGLHRGQGLCQFHWNAGNWGIDWAREVEAQKIEKHRDHCADCSYPRPCATLDKLIADAQYT